MDGRGGNEGGAGSMDGGVRAFLITDLYIGAGLSSLGCL